MDRVSENRALPCFLLVFFVCLGLFFCLFFFFWGGLGGGGCCCLWSRHPKTLLSPAGKNMVKFDSLEHIKPPCSIVKKLNALCQRE